jgi:23S rRNA pseudouridine1911/1915/1917 synthase
MASAPPSDLDANTEDHTADTLLFTVSPDSEGSRVDTWLSEQLDESRTAVARWISDGRVTLNNRPCARPAKKLFDGDQLVVDPPEPQDSEIVAEDIPLSIVYEDRWVIVIDKPVGMVMHPAPGHLRGTLVNALLHHCADLEGVGGERRPGIVHRIDKDTSGLVVAAKNDRAHQVLSAQFADRSVARRYDAFAVMLRGPGLEESGIIETMHERTPNDRRRFTGHNGGKVAITRYEVVERFEHGTLWVQCRLQTGRTHQIRMHLRESGCPLLGDSLYGGAAATTRLIKRQALHAAELGFTLPDGETIHFESPLPADMQSALDALRAGQSWR